MGWRIFEYTNRRGDSVIGEWLDQRAISKRDRGALVQKMDMLAIHGTTLSSGLLAGPIGSKRNPRREKHVYKLDVHGDRMLRPMLCKGPFDMDGEFTMLLGAIEINGVLDADAEEAEIRRATLLEDPSRRRLNGRYR